MAERALRGSGLGSKSHADPSGVELAPRQEIGFDCPKGHHFTIVFAEEAELLAGLSRADQERLAALLRKLSLDFDD